MPRPSSAVDIKPAVLKWARESSGWTVDEIAKKLKVSSAEYREWESTGQAVKLKHLETLNEVRAAIVLRLKNGYCFTDEMLQDKSMFQLLNLLILQALWLAVRIFAINYAASEIKVRRLCTMTTPGM